MQQQFPIQSPHDQLKRIIVEFKLAKLSEQEIEQIIQKVLSDLKNYSQCIDNMEIITKQKKTKLKQKIKKSQFYNQFLEQNDLYKLFKLAGLTQNYDVFQGLQDLYNKLAQSFQDFHSIIKNDQTLQDQEKNSLIKQIQKSNALQQSKLNQKINSDIKIQKMAQIKASLEKNLNKIQVKKQQHNKNLLKQNNPIQPSNQNFLNEIFENQIDQKQDRQCFIQQLLQNIINYNEIIRKSKLFGVPQQNKILKKLNQNQAFQKMIKNAIKESQIHQYLLKMSIKNERNNNVFAKHLTNCGWSVQQIVDAIDKMENQFLKQLFQKYDNLDLFFSNLFSYVNDCIIRKDNWERLVNIVKKVRNGAKKQKQDKQNKKLNERNKVLSKITFYDILCIIFSYRSNKKSIAYELSKTSIPIPIYYEIPQQQYVKAVSNINVLQHLILKLRPDNIILNIGFESTAKQGKTQFIEKIFYLNSTIIQSSSHYKQFSINVYPNTIRTKSGKKNLIIDVSSSIIKRCQSFNTVLNQLIRYSNIIIAHLNQQDLDSQNITPQTKFSFSNFNTDQFKKKKSIIGILRLKNKSKFDEKKQDLSGIKLINISNIGIINQNPQFIEQARDNIFQTLSISKNFQQKDIIQQTLFQNVTYLLDKLKNQVNVFPFTDLLVHKYQLEKQIAQNKNTVNEFKIEFQGDTYGEQMQNIHRIKNQLKMLNDKKINRSQTLNYFEKNIAQNQAGQQILAQSIKSWTLKNTEPIQKKYVDLTNKILVQKNKRNKENPQVNNPKILQNTEQYEETQQFKDLYQQMQVLEKCKECFDISVQSLYQQLIFSDQRLNQQIHKNLILKKYQAAYKNKIPMSLINGKTLSFGSKYLYNFFQNLNKQFEKDNKQLFVVTVIGNQSSAKSTLLNYLFGCSFSTSVGRCTKGVYYTLIQIQNKRILILDTQGLLSICARDKAFDIQITSLAFKISDLVLINIKGEVTSILKDLLDVCMYVLQHIFKELEEQNKKVKLLFILRDQAEFSETIQKKMLSQVINTLGKIQKIKHLNYTDYFIIQTDNIFPLKNAFVDKKYGLYVKQQNNDTFSQSIIILRSKIYNLLINPKHQNLSNFYYISSSTWRAILKCGTSIFNLQSLLQIEMKLDIQNRCKQIFKQCQNKSIQINKKNIQLNNNLKDLQYQSSVIRHKYNEMFGDLSKKINQQFLQKCKQKKWIIQKIDKYRQLIINIKNNSIKFLNAKISELNNEKKQKDFVQKIENIIENLGNQTDIKIEDQFQEKSSKLIEDFEKEIKMKLQYYSSEKFVINKKNQYWSQWFNKYEKLIRGTQQELIAKLQQSQNKNKFRDALIRSEYFQKISPTILNQSFALWVQYLNYSKKKVKKIFDDIQDLKQLQQSIINYEKISRQTIILTIDFRNQNLFEQKQPKKTIINTNVFDLLFISMRDQVPSLIYIKYKQISSERFNSLKKMVNNKKQQLNKALQYRGQYDKTASQWIILIDNKILQHLIKAAKQILRSHIYNQFRLKLGNSKIITLAFNMSLLLEKKGKDKWINCYKIITNINYFLKEIFYSTQAIKSLELKISSIKLDLEKQFGLITKKINQFLKNIQLNSQGNKQEKEDNSVFLNHLQTNLLDISLRLYKRRPKYQLAKILNFFKQKMNSIIESKMKEKYQQLYLKLNFETVNTFIKKELNQAQRDILGCQQKCPICKMKCCGQYGHLNSHHVLQNCHTMLCFGGYQNVHSHQAAKQMCFSDYDSVIRQNGKEYKNHLQFIRIQHKGWTGHFENCPKQNNVNFLSFKQTWANIYKMIIKYNHTKMIDSQVYKDVKQSLQQKDLQVDRLDMTYLNQKVLSILPGKIEIQKAQYTYKLKDYNKKKV